MDEVWWGILCHSLLSNDFNGLAGLVHVHPIVWVRTTGGLVHVMDEGGNGLELNHFGETV